MKIKNIHAWNCSNVMGLGCWPWHNKHWDLGSGLGLRLEKYNLDKPVTWNKSMPRIFDLRSFLLLQGNKCCN